MEHRQHRDIMEPDVMTFISLEGAARCRCWRSGQDRKDESGPGLATTDETELVVTMARTAVAMRRWLNIVGAERIGRTAVSHRHGKVMWIYCLMR